MTKSNIKTIHYYGTLIQGEVIVENNGIATISVNRKEFTGRIVERILKNEKNTDKK